MKITTRLAISALVCGLGAAPSLAQEKTAQEAGSPKTGVERQDKKAAKGQDAQGQDAKGKGKGRNKGEARAEGKGVKIGSRVPGRGGVPAATGAGAKRAGKGKDKNMDGGRTAGTPPPGTAQHINNLTRRVKDHRIRMAELERLESIFDGKDEAAQVGRVQKLRQMEKDHYVRTLARYEKLLGADIFKAFRERVLRDDRALGDDDN